MKNKFSKLGFTLIELLAAIVIIVVIIAISIPLVLNIIEAVKMEAFRATAYSISDSGRLLIANENEAQGYQEFYYREGVQYNADGKKLDYSGKSPITGVVILNENNKVVLAIHDGTYCATKPVNDNKITVTKTDPADCSVYNVIKTCDTWEQLAIKYDVTLDDLLAANNETDSYSSTCDRDIKIPVEATSAGGDYASEDDSESIVYYKTYYTVGYVTYSESFTSMSYEYTIKLGVLPLNISDIEVTNVTAQSVFESLDDFKRYIVKKNMGEVIWPGEIPAAIDLSQASVFRDHAADSTNMSADNVEVTCDTEACYATVSATVSNLNNVIPNTIEGVGQVAYTPIKFTVEFNGEEVCPTTPTPESCFVFSAGSITDYKYTTEGCSSDVVIPSSIGGVTVTTIGASAFQSNQLTCMTIPSTITNIGANAFASNNLASISVPSSVTIMGEHAFGWNPFTKGVIWNTSIASVGDYNDGPFEGATIGSITFGPGVTRVTNNLFAYTTPTFTSYTIPSSITVIGNDAFRNMGLTGLTIPNSIVNIGSGAFYDNNIGSLSIPSSVTTLGADSFSYNNLATITVPSTVTSMGEHAFGWNPLVDGVFWNTSIASIGDSNDGPFEGATIGSITFGPGVTRVTNNLFAYSFPTFTSYTVPDQITVIGNDAYRNMGLTEVNFHNALVNIGSGAFYDDNINSISIPSSVTTIGASAFSYNNLSTLTVPSTVTSIGERAFTYNPLTNGVFWNTSITSIGDNNDGPFVGATIGSITFGQGVTRVTNNLLAYSSPTFTSYTVPDQITVIGSDAYRNMGLTEVNFHNALVNIGSGAFYDDNINSISIPSSVTTIGASAFSYNNLSTLTVPSTVTSIGERAFTYNPLTNGLFWNTSITSIGDYNDGPFVGATIGSITFGPGVTRVTNNLLAYSSPTFNTYTVPDQITVIGSEAFRNMGLTTVNFHNALVNIGAGAFTSNIISSIDIPSSVTTIGSSAFASNTLASVTVPSTVTSVGERAFAYNPLTNGVFWNNSITSIGDYNDGPFYGATIGSITFGSGISRVTNYLLAYAIPTFTTYTVPDQITVIGSEAFRNMGLTTVNFHNALVNIGSGAFTGNLISSIDIPSSVTTLGSSAFDNNKLNSVTVPSTITSIGGRAFAYNPLTNGVFWNNSITSIGDYNDGPFYGATIGSITFGSGISRVTSFLFSYAIPTFTSYTIPSTITVLGNDCFRNMVGLKSITIPDSVVTIEGWVFKDDKLSSVTIPNSVTSIGQEAFYANSLSTVAIPNSTTSIGKNAFAGIATLASATIDNSPASVTLGSTPFGTVTPTFLR